MIQLVLSSAPIDEVPGKVAVLTFFEDQRPLQGSTGLIDWRLNGRVSDMILQGRLGGHFAESLIMPSQGRLASDEILLFGLGRHEAFSEREMEKGFSQLIEKLCRLKSTQCVVSFRELAKDFMGWRGVLRNFMNALAQRAKGEDIEIVCTEDPQWIHEAKRRNMDFGPEVELTYA